MEKRVLGEKAVPLPHVHQKPSTDVRDIEPRRPR